MENRIELEGYYLIENGVPVAGGFVRDGIMDHHGYASAEFQKLYMNNWKPETEIRWDPAGERPDYSTMAEVRVSGDKLGIKVVPIDKIYKEQD